MYVNNANRIRTCKVASDTRNLPLKLSATNVNKYTKALGKYGVFFPLWVTAFKWITCISCDYIFNDDNISLSLSLSDFDFR